MLVATQLPRTFLFKDKGMDISLSDPEPKLSPQAVLNFYANTYPELVTAKIDGPVIADDQVQYQFVSTIGTKG